MIKVLHVYRTYFPDSESGISALIRQLCLMGDDHEVSYRIFTLSDHPEPAIIQPDKFEIYRFKKHLSISSCDISISPKTLFGFKALVDWADIIHYHFPWPLADLLHYLARVKKPTLVTYHSDIVRQNRLFMVYKPLMNAFLKCTDVIVATSKPYAETSQVLRQYKKKTTVIPIGLSENTYPSISQQTLSCWRHRVGEGFFLFVGVLRYYKGLSVLLEALHETNLCCVIAGTGPEEKMLQRQAKHLKLSQVKWLGHIDEDSKIALMHLCRAVVFPSHVRAEAFGVTLLEGAMCGKPLISTAIGTGTSYVNKHNETGFVIPPNDSVELRKAMLRLAADTKLAHVMGVAARRRYEHKFTANLMSEAYVRQYNRLLTSSSVNVHSESLFG